jgi:hypothetical protein
LPSFGFETSTRVCNFGEEPANAFRESEFKLVVWMLTDVKLEDKILSGTGPAVKFLISV